jgi:hypothetical protein
MFCPGTLGDALFSKTPEYLMNAGICVAFCSFKPKNYRPAYMTGSSAFTYSNHKLVGDDNAGNAIALLGNPLPRVSS